MAKEGTVLGEVGWTSRERAAVQSHPSDVSSRETIHGGVPSDEGELDWQLGRA